MAQDLDTVLRELHHAGFSALASEITGLQPQKVRGRTTSYTRFVASVSRFKEDCRHPAGCLRRRCVPPAVAGRLPLLRNTAYFPPPPSSP